VAGTPLKDWNIQINYGIKTGFNDAFIISTAKRDEILANCQTEDERKRTEEIIRPILRGRDIKRYSYDWAGLWLINTHNGVKENGQVKIPRIKIDDYPTLRSHFDKYGERLVHRADQGDTPYNLRNCAYLEDFLKPKIVWGEISDIPKFGFDAKGEMYCEATSFLMVGDDLPFIYLFLNSTICLYQFCKIGTTTGVGTLRWKKYKIQEILVPTEYDKKAVLDLVERILATKHVTNTAALKLKIDSFFYELYGLTEVEIQEIKASCPNLFLNQFQQNQ
ncbi:TaqI-like C-terminal specificity domain-containing protein, partial [Synergistes jonesii]|uniref:TaqI-like C-terminal specificity domain-containing protein n=1 Tax=Synergistes jonesii TaxID=2754 RepID=UPI000AAB1527